jgi:hypothetical protein
VIVLVLTGALCLGAVPAAHAGTSALQSPTMSFSTYGKKHVILKVCNGPTACTSVPQDIDVLDPRPVVTSAAPAWTTAEVGQLVRLDGTGTGQPPLSFNWIVTPPPIALPFTGSGAPTAGSGATTWWDTTGLSPGSYAVALSISNASGATLPSLPSTVRLLAAPATDFYTVIPCRAYDSRSGAALASGSNTVIRVAAAPCGIPATARAVVGNLTVVNPDGQGFVSLYPGNYPQPATSTANFVGGTVRGNSMVMPMATDGTGTLMLFLTVANNGTAHAVLDVTGYFAP